MPIIASFTFGDALLITEDEFQKAKAKALS
jgi:hypothetical protein